jgi:diadenylate cyclase
VCSPAPQIDLQIKVSTAVGLVAKASDIDLPMGLGSRHLAAASITKVARAIAVVVSESAIVRIFDSGAMVGDIIPELWLLSPENVIANPRTPKG